MLFQDHVVRREFTSVGIITSVLTEPTVSMRTQTTRKISVFCQPLSCYARIYTGLGCFRSIKIPLNFDKIVFSRCLVDPII